MNRRILIWGTASLVALALAAGAAFFLFLPKPVEMIHPRIGRAITAVYGSGTVEATVMMPVAPRTGARLVELAADEGSEVKKGQVLGQLENIDLQSNIAQLVAQEDFARRDFARDAALLKQGAISRQTFDRARSAWDSARAAVDQARAQSGFMQLISPGDCIVIQRDGEIGQYIPANTPVFWISCNRQFRISAQIDEEDVPLVRPGEAVLIRADAFPTQTFNGRVASVTPRGDPIGRSYRVRIELPPGSPLQIGMTTEVNIIARDNPNAILLPESAISDGAVYSVARGNVVRIPVATGAKNNGWVEIVNGIRPEALVVKNAADAALARAELRSESPP